MEPHGLWTYASIISCNSFNETNKNNNIINDTYFIHIQQYLITATVIGKMNMVS